MLRTTCTTLTFAALLALSGCAAGIPDETLDEGEKQQPATGVTIEVPTVPVYFNYDNRLHVDDETPWVYGRFDLVAKGKVLIDLSKEESDPAGPVSFKLYGVTATGKLRYLATVDGPHGEARATLRSTQGGTYVVEVVGEPHPAALVLDLTCMSSKCTNQRQPGDMCGGFAGFVCADGLTCHYPDGSCHWGDPSGTCQVPPTVCPRFWAPQCGCDGVTYGNTCEALKAGVTIDHAGVCPDPNAHGEGQTCGGIAALKCATGLYCDYPAGTCSWGDPSGVCVSLPATCPVTFAAVCGCNGQTYSSECEATKAGVRVDHVGGC